MQDRIYLDRDWLFCPRFEEKWQSAPMEEGERVLLPHTVRELPLHYFDEALYQCLSTYQRWLYGDPAYEGRRLLLTFEGAAHEATVFLNGEKLGSHRCGYTAFTLDITDKLIPGEDNLLTVRLDSRESLDQPPFGFVIDYMTFGGLYRDVYLTVKDPLHLTDVFYKPSVKSVSTEGLSDEEITSLSVPAELESEISLSEKAREAEGLSIRQYLDGALILDSPLGSLTREESKGIFRARVSLPSVGLWDIVSPRRYEVRTELLEKGEVRDAHTFLIGFRRAAFTGKGFFLNGRRLHLRGLNRHQSYAYLGYAAPESLQREDARLLKEEMAVNIVRTSHYPQSHYFIDECDRLGLLVVTEMPGWQHIGGKAWQDQAVKNVCDMVSQYRNHPSILLWGVRINESEDNDAFYARTNAAAHALDRTRPTCGVRNQTATGRTVIQEDVFTYNDFVHDGTNRGCLRKSFAMNGSDKPYLITEHNGHMFPTKNADPEEHRVSHMLRHARVMNDVIAEGNICGCIGWCFADYNTHRDFGSGDRICYHGLTDIFRNPKTAAALYAAQGQESDVLAVTSSMDIGEHPACNKGATYILSNADSVRMYKNGSLLKEYFPENTAFQALPHGPILIDDYIGNAIREGEDWPEEKADLVKKLLNAYCLSNGKIEGKMRPLALRLMVKEKMTITDALSLFQKYIGDWGGVSKEYVFEAIRDGQVVKTLKKGAVTSASLKVTVSSERLTEGITYDMAAIRIQAVDQDGNVLPFAGEPLKLETDGPIRLVGPDMISLSGGMTGTYVRTVGEEGKARLVIRSAQYGRVEIGFEVNV